MNLDNEVFYHNSVVLNTELMTAADFIFDSIIDFINVTYFQSYSESKIFKSYYLLSVGVERLQKVILTMTYNCIGNEEKDKFENRILKALHKHNHEILSELLQEYTGIDNKFSKEDNKLLSKLMSFYNKQRYIKYNENTDIDDIYKFHLGYRYIINNQNDDFRKKTLEIISCLESILTSYFKMLGELQKRTRNYLGECGSDTKLFIIKNISKNLRNYFKLFYLGKYEFQKFINGNSNLKPEYLGYYYESYIDIDTFYNGNGNFLIDWMLTYYMNLNNLELVGDDYVFFYNGDEDFAYKNRMTRKLVEFYEARNPIADYYL